MKKHKANIAIMIITRMIATCCMQACGLNSLVDYFNVKTLDILEGYKRWCDNKEGNITEARV